MNELPLFPLGSVLFPGGRMPLQIFEQRYLDLVRSCTREGTGFGQVWLARGNEIAGSDERSDVMGGWGTYARIIDWDSLPNGLLGITIEGGDRFRLQDYHQRESQLYVGEVEMLPPREPEPLIDEWGSMLEVLNHLEQHPHVQRLGIQVDHSDAWQVGYALAQLLPVEEAFKHKLLGDDDIDSFMDRLDQLLNELGGMDA